MKPIVRRLLNAPDVDMVILTIVVAAGLYAVTTLHTAEAGNVDLKSSTENAAAMLASPLKDTSKTAQVIPGSRVSYQIREEFDYTTSRPKAVVLEVTASTGSTP